MKINLEIIQYNLKIVETKLYLGNENVSNVTHARLLRPGQGTWEPDVVYIGGLSDVPDFSSGNMPPNLILAAADAQAFPPEISTNILWVQGWEVPVLFNAVQQIFDRYQTINHDLIEAILNEEPIQTILDRCTHFFENPVYIVDSAMKLVMHSSNLLDSELGPAWIETLSSGFTSVKVMNALRRADLLEKLNNALYPSLIDLAGIAPPWLTANVFAGKTRIASVGVAALLTPVSRAHLGLLEHVTGLLTTILGKRHNLTYVRSAGDDRFLIDLLTGASMDKGILSHHLSRIGWTREGDFLLFKILPTPKDLSGGTLEYSGKMVASFFEESRMVILGDALVLVANVTGFSKARLDQVLSRLNGFLKKREFKGGMSMKFHCFTGLYAQYQLAAAALDIDSRMGGQAANLLLYEDYVMAHLFKSCETRLDLQMLCHPEVLKLNAYDRESRSELLHTLYTFLVKERSLVAAAMTLNIHRNTLVYRINKITSIIDVDLDDDGNRRHLILSCEILNYIEDKYAGIPGV